MDHGVPDIMLNVLLLINPATVRSRFLSLPIFVFRSSLSFLSFSLQNRQRQLPSLICTLIPVPRLLMNSSPENPTSLGNTLFSFRNPFLLGLSIIQAQIEISLFNLFNFVTFAREIQGPKDEYMLPFWTMTFSCSLIDLVISFFFFWTFLWVYRFKKANLQFQKCIAASGRLPIWSLVFILAADIFWYRV